MTDHLNWIAFNTYCVKSKLLYINNLCFQCCAVAFMENMNAESLNLSGEEFERFMSGEATPNDPNMHHSCEGLKLLQENMQVGTKRN